MILINHTIYIFYLYCIIHFQINRSTNLYYLHSYKHITCYIPTSMQYTSSLTYITYLIFIIFLTYTCQSFITRKTYLPSTLYYNNVLISICSCTTSSFHVKVNNLYQNFPTIISRTSLYHLLILFLDKYQLLSSPDIIILPIIIIQFKCPTHIAVNMDYY